MCVYIYACKYIYTYTYLYIYIYQFLALGASPCWSDLPDQNDGGNTSSCRGPDWEDRVGQSLGFKVGGFRIRA